MPLLRSGRMTEQGDHTVPGVVERCTAYRFRAASADTPGTGLDFLRPQAPLDSPARTANPHRSTIQNPSSSRNPVVSRHLDDTFCDRCRPPVPVHTTVEQVLTVLIITAVDSVDKPHHCRSYGSPSPWMKRGGLAQRRGPTVHEDAEALDSCHSSVHIDSCVNGCHSTVSTELSTIGENSALTSIVLQTDTNRPESCPDPLLQRRRAADAHCRVAELELLIRAVSSVT